MLNNSFANPTQPVPPGTPTGTPVVVTVPVNMPTPISPTLVPTPSVPGSGLNIPALMDAIGSWLGVPYSWGGCNHHGVDCSCFVKNVLAVFGINAPRTTPSQIAWATPITAGQAQPGDLVFFDNTCTECGANPTHVGMVIGPGMMVDAGDPVRIEHIFTGHNARYGRPH